MVVVAGALIGLAGVLVGVVLTPYFNLRQAHRERREDVFADYLGSAADAMSAKIDAENEDDDEAWARLFDAIRRVAFIASTGGSSSLASVTSESPPHPFTCWSHLSLTRTKIRTWSMACTAMHGACVFRR